MKKIILLIQAFVLTALYSFWQIGSENIRHYHKVFGNDDLYYKFLNIKDIGESLFNFLAIWFLVNLFKKSFKKSFFIWYSIFNLLPAMIVIVIAANLLNKVNDRIDNTEVIVEGDTRIILEYKNKTTLWKRTENINYSLVREIYYYKNGQQQYIFDEERQQDTLWYPSGQIQLITKTLYNRYKLFTQPQQIQRSFTNENYINYESFKRIEFLAYWNEEGKQLLKDGNGSVVLYYPNGKVAYIRHFKNYMTTKIRTFDLNGQKKIEIDYIIPDFSNFVCAPYEFQTLYDIEWTYAKKKFHEDGHIISDDYIIKEFENLPIIGTGTIRLNHQDGSLEREIIQEYDQIVKILIYHFNGDIKTTIEFQVPNKFKGKQVSRDRFLDLSYLDLEKIQTIDEWKSVRKNYNEKGDLITIEYNIYPLRTYTEIIAEE